MEGTKRILLKGLKYTLEQVAGAGFQNEPCKSRTRVANDVLAERSGNVRNTARSSGAVEAMLW